MTPNERPTTKFCFRLDLDKSSATSIHKNPSTFIRNIPNFFPPIPNSVSRFQFHQKNQHGIWKENPFWPVWIFLSRFHQNPRSWFVFFNSNFHSFYRKDLNSQTRKWRSIKQSERAMIKSWKPSIIKPSMLFKELLLFTRKFHFYMFDY